MGIRCEINLSQPPDVTYQPGQVVSGKIKYILDKPMEVENITISLKGRGDITIYLTTQKYTRTHKYNEIYVDLENNVMYGQTKIPAGSYEVDFNFIIPYNIPSTTVIKRYLPGSHVSAKIKYFVGIHIETYGLFKFNESISKEITIVSEGRSTILPEPMTVEEKMDIIRLFSSKTGYIKLKVTVQTAVVPIGGKINVKYEIENNSNVQIKSINSKLIEVFDFKANYLYKKYIRTVLSTNYKVARTRNSEETQVIPVEICIPSDRHTLDYSEIIKRHYILKVTTLLPIPQRNINIDIPIQIGFVSEDVGEGRNRGNGENPIDAPPSYWEVMREMFNNNESNRYMENSGMA